MKIKQKSQETRTEFLKICDYIDKRVKNIYNLT